MKLNNKPISPKLLIKSHEYTKPIRLCPFLKDYKCFFDIQHPLSDNNGRVLYHRHQMSIKLGRWVLTEEDVHHLNENKSDNSFDNLFLLSRSEHGTLHATLTENPCTKISYCLYCKKVFKYKKDISHCSKLCWLTKKEINQLKYAAPDKELLENLIKSKPAVEIAKMYSVSDKTVTKWCRQYNLNKPGVGYWAKLKAKNKT